MDRAVDGGLVPVRDGDFGLVAIRIGETVPGQRPDDNAFALFGVLRDDTQETVTLLLLLMLFDMLIYQCYCYL